MIEFISGGMLLVSTIGIHMNTSTVNYASANSTPATNTEEIVRIEDNKISPITDIKVNTNTNKGLENKIRTYYKNDPLLIQIAKCESGFSQYDKNGEILRGKVNPKDVGIMQINEEYHLERAMSLGYDIYTIEGNLSYARLMSRDQGGLPWMASSKCWSQVTYK